MPFTESESYLEAFEAVVPQALTQFAPHVLVVQAGADAYFSDPLGDLALTTQAFETLFHRILQLATTHTKGRILVTLGGGYEAQVVARVWTILYLTMLGFPLSMELTGAWLEQWRTLLGPKVGHTLHDPVPAYPELPDREERARRNRDVVGRLLDSLLRFWL